MYNLTAINTTNIVTFIQGENTVLLGGMLGIILLFGLAIIMFMMFFRAIGTTGKAMTATAFVTFILSILLRTLQLIDDTTIYVTLFVLAAAVAITWNS